MTTVDAAAALGVTRCRVNQLVAQGRIPARKFGSILMLLRSDVEAFTPLPSGWQKGRKRGPKSRRAHEAQEE